MIAHLLVALQRDSAVRSGDRRDDAAVDERDVLTLQIERWKGLIELSDERGDLALADGVCLRR